MADDTTQGTATEEQEEPISLVHEDIVQRLLEYQRELRGGPQGPPEADRPMVDYEAIEDTTPSATVTVTDELVDLTAAEEAMPVVEEATPPDEDPVPRSEIQSRIAEGAAMRKQLIERAQEAGGTTDGASTPTEDVITIEDAEPAEIVTVAAPASPATDDLADRLTTLESALARIESMLGGARSDFQDLAIRADQRIGEIESAIARAREGGS